MNEEIDYQSTKHTRVRAQSSILKIMLHLLLKMNSSVKLCQLRHHPMLPQNTGDEVNSSSHSPK